LKRQNKMPEFRYVTKDKSGRTLSGKKTANSKGELISELGRANLTVVSIKEIGKKGKEGFKKAASKPIFSRGVKTFDLLIFCRQLATMLKGGVHILRAIESIASEVKNKRFRSILESVTKDLRGGDSLSESLKKYPEAFTELIIAIVEAGEKVGSLDDMLLRVSGYLESKDRLRRKIRAATTYPTAIALFFICAVSFITLFIIPRFKGMYETFGADLPALTRTIFEISNFAIRNVWFILAGIIITIFSIVFFITQTKKGKFIFNKFTLKIPIFGDVVKKAAVSKFCRTLSTLLDQGIPVTESLILVGRTSGNILIENASNRASKLVLEGAIIPEALNKMEIFPPLMLQMASVGTESGSLPLLLDKTADFYEEQVDTFVSVLTSMIEPILVVCLGAVIGVVVIAIYLPIFNLSSAMGKGVH